MSFIFDICQSLYDLPMSEALRESDWSFPIVETVHVLAITLMVGTIAIVDLRILGVVLREEPVTFIVSRLLPITWTGFVILVISGFVLFCSEAIKLYSNPAFQIKVVLIALAGLNVLIFHGLATRRKTVPNPAREPFNARSSALLSLVFWASVIVSGRMIAYFH